jgi:D-lyxose ketol-isomerase
MEILFGERIMKRSDVNQLILEGMEFMQGRGFCLPPFWRLKGPECRQITDAQEVRGSKKYPEGVIDE